MRSTLILAGLALATNLAACSKHDEAPAAPLNSTTAPAGFHPPTALNRTDFTTMIDKGFERLDVDHDVFLSKAELPLRHHDTIASFDKDGDDKISKSEFDLGSLERFDKADTNQDKVLTGEERRVAKIGDDEDDGNLQAPAATS